MKTAIDIQSLREDFREGRNVMHAYNACAATDCNPPEGIEIAYELQAGQYIRNQAGDPAYYDAYTDEQAALVQTHFPDCESLLDAGCGELTNSALLFGKLTNVETHLGFDLSWSRVHVGWQHFRRSVDTQICNRTGVFVAEMAEIPLPDNAIDVVVTSHALEPNGGREALLVAELMRVARLGLLLFEPSWELGDDDQCAYMDKHGYVRDLAGHCTRVGGQVIAQQLTETHHNPRNRTAVIAARKRTAGAGNTSPRNDPVLVDPVTRGPLTFDSVDSVYVSRERAVVYPTLRGIPILKDSAAILAAGLGDDAA